MVPWAGATFPTFSEGGRNILLDRELGIGWRDLKKLGSFGRMHSLPNCLGHVSCIIYNDGMLEKFKILKA